MSFFRRDTSLVKVKLPSPTDCMGMIVAVPKRAAEGINLLNERIRDLTWELDAVRALNVALDAENERLIAANAEIAANADEVSRAATAMRDAFRGEIEALNQVVDGLNAALAVERAARGRAQAEVHRLDAELVKTGADLGQAREEHRLLLQRWARHLNTCTVADAIDQEDAAKARTR